jgi:hypothetical protein
MINGTSLNELHYLVHSYRDQQWHEVSFKKTAEEPVINEKDWPRTLETIKEYRASQYG